MPDFTDLVSQAKKMQEKMKETQEALNKIEVEGISGGGTVKAIMNGDGYSGIRGIYYKDNSEIIKNRDQEIIDLNDYVLLSYNQL